MGNHEWGIMALVMTGMDPTPFGAIPRLPQLFIPLFWMRGPIGCGGEWDEMSFMMSQSKRPKGLIDRLKIASSKGWYRCPTPTHYRIVGLHRRCVMSRHGAMIERVSNASSDCCSPLC